MNSEVKVAWIGGAFLLAAAVIAAVASWYATTSHDDDVELSGFSLSTRDSLYACDPCDLLHRNSGATAYIKPSPEWQMTINLIDEVDMWGDAGVASDDPRYVGFDKRYQENPDFYKSRLNPVFDLVLSNTGTGSAVLTDIEIKVIKADIAAQGDGVESRSGTLRSLARYTIEFSDWYGDCCAVSTLDPPLSIQPNDPARFQVEFAPKDGAPRTIYELSLVLWFSDDESLETDPFILEM